MVKESIEINLIGQKESLPKKLTYGLGIFYVLFLPMVVFISDWTIRINYVLGVLFLPGMAASIFYALGQRRILKGLFPFLRIDHEKISHNKIGLFARAKTLYWDQVGQLDVKLFELIIKSKDGKLTHVDLIRLTDENRKMVKELVSTIKAERGI